MSLQSLTIDIGLICGLLLIGVLIRAKVGWAQKLFMPASLIAGFLALALGPNGVGWLPFSTALPEYPEILIAVIFGAIPLGAARVDWRATFKRVRNMWTYSLLLELLMWGGGVFIALIVLRNFWEIPQGFGLVLGAGFLGGHGTAAAVGEALADLGWQEAPTLGYTAATVGLLCAIVGGLLITKFHARRNNTNFISDVNDLPEDLRTGLVKTKDRTASGLNTVSSNTVDPLFFQIAVIGVVVILSFYAQQGLASLLAGISVPLLSVAFIVGLLVQQAMRATGSVGYLDKPTIDRVSGTATDLTVALGIASINLSVAAEYLAPLIALFVFGVIWAYGIFHFIAPRVFHQHWFENGLFGWGWSTGTVAMGIALLKVVDPKSEATTLEDYGIAYVGIVPFEVLIITFGPLLVMSGFGLGYIGILLGAALALFFIAKFSRWLVPNGQMAQERVPAGRGTSTLPGVGGSRHHTH